ncbi:MAG: galactose oxidase-like domain-containing protein, partial [Thermosynechococcaceae cyanobacterium]
GQDCPDCSAIWDYTNGNSFTQPLTPLLPSGIPYDFFCCGHAFLPNGNLFVAGGTIALNPSLGLPSSFIFNAGTLKWQTKLYDMDHGRWYPTLTRLSDSRILAVAGFDENGLLNKVPEIFTPRGWRSFTSPTTISYPNYTAILLLEDGRLFSPGNNRDNGEAFIITLPSSFSQPITQKIVKGLVNPTFSKYACVVLLPPAQDQKIMFIGGYDSERQTEPTSRRVNVVDLKSSAPVYTSAPPLRFGRCDHQAIILPDRTVLVTGGTRIRNSKPDAVFAAELYNPRNGTWTTLASASVPRLYHSVGLLLPDGRVLSAGSNVDSKDYEYRLEIYSPPYLFKGQRPVITANLTGVEISYNQTITIETTQTSDIKWVELIRPSAVTHSVDVEQRLIDLPFTVNNNKLQVQIIGNSNLAPSGWYMLFIVNRKSIPSKAIWVHLT